MTYVVVGAGPSGVVAAETLRKADAETEIVLIGEEPEPPYSRMAIPYYLTGKIDEAGTYLRKTDGHYDTKNITYQQGKVESVDAEAGKLNLHGGGSQDYDKLLICTGASPIKPPVEGLDQPGVHHCWTLEDARQIIGLAHEGADVVLIGAGFIACIILEALVERGVNLSVVEMEERMLPRMMDEIGGDMIKRWCVNKGVNVQTGRRVTKLDAAGGAGEDRLTVNLDDGTEMPAHLVVVAAGVASNTGFLQGSGVEVKTGIVVNNHLESSVAGIYAAGDCAEGPDFSTGGWSVHAIQPTAVDHGRIAALNMAGKPTPYRGSLVMNVLDTMGLVSVSFGAWEGVEGGERATIVDDDQFRYLRLEFDGERLVGALSLGRTDHVGVLRGLIQNRALLGEWKAILMDDPNKFMDAYVAHSQ
ncbi:MAG: NAD(P)/FAD-dependent oxidoreductase [Rhodospirillaceae bacterium]|jgi:NADPH-dependent 2,4-dienoyl-CoA reductase/sulfur reductase-like enzyme|nr:NAD(P)/FAD-dependent oxidoreductase [Rhodospirillaceae bacterium]MBT6085553.1 NAD(P)/FAD-dependent oxidoreductase [Rhodospirillaceae bacterium]MBT6609804.1 NAD(P)/FAD-dependent oxidoreductase [Rhodospirillaceae bacterium]MBT6886202.1 NAD(P)/FAD-dependent oxidoreductase [Rhodospirillaceae bacterium]MBT7249603.1 NAD(P)/FAD-dependent oxidoreductase [Rhodospirillaceae bacterium]